jgi:hypothetical protein
MSPLTSVKSYLKEDFVAGTFAGGMDVRAGGLIMSRIYLCQSFK